MPFWLHENSLKTRLRVVSLRERILLSTFVLTVTAGTFYFYLIKPKQYVIKQREHVLQQLQKKQKELAGNAIAYQKLQADYDALKKYHDDHAMHTFSEQGCIDELFGLIKQSKLVCQAFTPAPSEIALVLNGSYTNLCLLLELLASKKLPLTIIKLDVQPYKNRLLQINLSIKMGMT